MIASTTGDAGPTTARRVLEQEVSRKAVGSLGQGTAVVGDDDARVSHGRLPSLGGLWSLCGVTQRLSGSPRQLNKEARSWRVRFRRFHATTILNSLARPWQKMKRPSTQGGMP